MKVTPFVILALAIVGSCAAIRFFPKMPGFPRLPRIPLPNRPLPLPPPRPPPPQHQLPLPRMPPAPHLNQLPGPRNLPIPLPAPKSPIQGPKSRTFSDVNLQPASNPNQENPLSRSSSGLSVSSKTNGKMENQIAIRPEMPIEKRPALENTPSASSSSGGNQQIALKPEKSTGNRPAGEKSQSGSLSLPGNQLETVKAERPVVNRPGGGNVQSPPSSIDGNQPSRRGSDVSINTMADSTRGNAASNGIQPIIINQPGPSNSFLRDLTMPLAIGVTSAIGQIGAAAILVSSQHGVAQHPDQQQNFDAWAHYYDRLREINATEAAWEEYRKNLAVNMTLSLPDVDLAAAVNETLSSPVLQKNATGSDDAESKVNSVLDKNSTSVSLAAVAGDSEVVQFIYKVIAFSAVGFVFIGFLCCCGCVCVFVVKDRKCRHQNPCALPMR